MQTVGIIGGGAWGTALATVAARAGRHFGRHNPDPGNARLARWLSRRGIVGTSAVQANVAYDESRVSGEGLQNLGGAARHQAGKSEENSSSPHRKFGTM